MALKTGGMWRGWEEEVRDAYEMGGKALGELLTRKPELEDQIWNLVGKPTGWPRRWLKGFRQMWIRENPDLARLLISRASTRAYDRRRSCAKKARSLADAHRLASDEVSAALRKRKLEEP
jgi:hypothetical protein